MHAIKLDYTGLVFILLDEYQKSKVKKQIYLRSENDGRGLKIYFN